MIQNKIGIIGHGEIGKSIEKLYALKETKCNICDINRCDDMINCEYLHICIPYTSNFIDIASEYIDKFSPKHIIVHSTVQLGTTTKIENKTRRNIVHSPIRGLHPNLLAGILTFTAFIGSNNIEEAIAIKTLYELLGIPSVEVCNNPETTELAKLLDTTYYGVCIAFHKEAKKLCDSYELDFDKVMTEYNRTYNIGYTILGKPNVVRPVLKDIPGPIGGHCVVPNADILSTIWNSNIIKLIQEYR